MKDLRNIGSDLYLLIIISLMSCYSVDETNQIILMHNIRHVKGS